VLIIWAIVIYIAYNIFKWLVLPKVNGHFGEFQVSLLLKRLNKKNYRVFNNIYLEKAGWSVQIDHLIISIYGVFVIETKNYKGWIFGNEKSKYWTQTLFKRKYKIYNPISQNWSHVNFIKSIFFNLDASCYLPLVVFAGSATLKKIEASTPVIYKRELLRSIKRRKEVVLTHRQLDELAAVVTRYLKKGKKIEKTHKNFVKKAIKKNRNDQNIRQCPKCGSKLVKKQGKFGWFYGCSKFPNCTFTKNIR
jgi:hypothetical protein